MTRTAAVAMLVGLASLHGAEADALAISANIQARHLPFGTILDPFYASAASTQVTGYTRCGDSAIWTGHYLAAEAYRFAVTRDAGALSNARQAFEGVKALVDVTGTNLLARCRIAVSSPFAPGIEREEVANGVYSNSAAGFTWIGNTSRDQYCGAIFGLSVAYSTIPELQNPIREVVTRMVNFLIVNNWTAPMPDGRTGTTFALRPDQQLAILQVARQVNPAQFAAPYEAQSQRSAASVATPVAFDSLSTNSYFKFNLIYISFFHLIRLEEGPLRATYERAYGIARNYTAAHQNAFFNMVDRALFGPNGARDAETLALLDLWLKRSRRDIFVDLRTRVQTCGEQACVPVPVDQRTPTDFLWQRNPFQLFGGGTGTIGNAGVDYILPYWMARYYGVIGDFKVQSAAAVTTAIAPDSLASLYGAALAKQTAFSDAPVESLGGVSVRIAAADGAEHLARLLYVSPGQINFLVPANVNAGAAKISVLAADGSSLQSITSLQATAPGLFTMNGRLSAATAIRVQSGIQTPVPVFTCGAGGCTATPLEVAAGAPVFLTLYGTGLRRRRQASVTIRGTEVPVLYAGAQPSYPGLDQVNVELPARLAGGGEVEIVLTVDGERSNAVVVSVR